MCVCVFVNAFVGLQDNSPTHVHIILKMWQCVLVMLNGSCIMAQADSILALSWYGVGLCCS